MPQYKFIDPPEQYRILDTPAEDVPELKPAPTIPGPEEVGIDPVPSTPLGTGVAEVGAQMITGFMAALPATAAGIYQAIEDKDINSYDEAFAFVQDKYTYKPRTPEGKVIERMVGRLFEAYSEAVDKEVVGDNPERGNVITATVGKVSAEALPLLLPFYRKGGPGRPPVEGEVQPREAPPSPGEQGRGPPALERPIIEGEATRAVPDPALPAPDGPQGRPIPEAVPALEAPIVEPIRYQMLPRDTASAKRIDIQLAKQDGKSVAKMFDNADIDAAAATDPYMKGEPEVPYPPGEPVMMNSGLPWEQVQQGLAQVWDVIDTSNSMRQWRNFARPLQAGTPEMAGQVKDFANLKRVHAREHAQTLKILDEISPATRETMIRAIENPSLRESLSPELTEGLDALIAENEGLSQQALDLGIIGNIRKPYAPHIVKTASRGPWAEQLLKQGYLKTAVHPAGTRKHATFEAGESAGVEYVKDIKALADINYQLKEAIIGKHFVNYVKQWDTGGAELIGFPGQAIPGYVTINHPAFQSKTYMTTESVKYKGKNYYVKDGAVTIDAKSYPIFGSRVYVEGKQYEVSSFPDVITKQIKVHPDLAGPLRAVLESDNPTMLTRAMIQVKAATIGIIMYNPMFHNFTVFSKITPTLPGAGFGEYIWNPQKIIGEGVYDKLSPAQKALSRTWFSDYAVGNYLNGTEANVIDAMKHNLVPLGGRGYRADLYGDMSEVRGNILRNFSATEGLGKAVEKLGDFWHGYLLWDRIADAQMGLYNRYSIEFTERGIKQYMKDNNGRTPTAKEIAQIREDSKYQAGEFANLIVGTFGKEDFGHAWRNFLNVSLFSRSYTMSNVRLAEYATGIIPKHLLAQAKTMKPEAVQKLFTGYAALTVTKDLFLMLGTLYALNWAFTSYNNIPDKHGNVGGHFPEQNEPKKELYIAMGEKPDGSVVYMGIPYRAARDIFEMAVKPATLLNNKLNPALKMGWEELTNRDWKGNSIRVEGSSGWDKVWQTAEHMAATTTGYNTAFDTFAPDDDSWRNRFRFTGLQISHGAKGGMVVGNIRNMQREQQAQKDLVINESVELMKRKKDQEAIDLLVTNGLIGEIPGFILRSKDPHTSLLINMNLGQLYQRATPEQKKELDQINFGRKSP